MILPVLAGLAGLSLLGNPPRRKRRRNPGPTAKDIQRLELLQRELAVAEGARKHADLSGTPAQRRKAREEAVRARKLYRQFWYSAAEASGIHRKNPKGLAAYAQQVVGALVWTHSAAPKIPRPAMGMVREAFHRDIDHEAVAGWIAAGKTSLPASIRGAFPKSKGELKAWAKRNKVKLNPSRDPMKLIKKGSLVVVDVGQELPAVGHAHTKNADGSWVLVAPGPQHRQVATANAGNLLSVHAPRKRGAPFGLLPPPLWAYPGWEPGKRHFHVAAHNNPPRDPVYQGAFTAGHEPKRTGPYVDGDTAIVQSPYRTSKHIEAPWEVWIFGMVDPVLGNNWNYAAGPMGKSDAIEAAKKLTRY